MEPPRLGYTVPEQWLKPIVFLMGTLSALNMGYCFHVTMLSYRRRVMGNRAWLDARGCTLILAPILCLLLSLNDIAITLQPTYPFVVPWPQFAITRIVIFCILPPLGGMAMTLRATQLCFKSSRVIKWHIRFVIVLGIITYVSNVITMFELWHSYEETNAWGTITDIPAIIAVPMAFWPIHAVAMTLYTLKISFSQSHSNAINIPKSINEQGAPKMTTPYSEFENRPVSTANKIESPPRLRPSGLQASVGRTFRIVSWLNILIWFMTIGLSEWVAPHFSFVPRQVIYSFPFPFVVFLELLFSHLVHLHARQARQRNLQNKAITIMTV